MSLPVYEIEPGFEAKVTTFLEGHGYLFLPTKKRVYSDGAHPGTEQNWGITLAGQEIARLCVIDTNKGRKLLIWGPLHNRTHKAIYRLLKDEVLKLGAHPLADLNEAFEPLEKTKT